MCVPATARIHNLTIYALPALPAVPVALIMGMYECRRE